MHSAQTAHSTASVAEHVSDLAHVIGYDAFNDPYVAEEALAISDLENEAHAQKVLLSSDAMRYFISAVPLRAERSDALAKVLVQAKNSFPSEDGWLVLNAERMETLLASTLEIEHTPIAIDVSQDLESSVSFIPMTAGSLAEAILTKDTTLAYLLASDRPMIALADAVSDITLLRAYLHGEQVSISDLLKNEGNKLPMETIEEVLWALSSALDGTSHNEIEAVKLAISRAVAVLV